MDDIHRDLHKTAQEKQSMMDMLRKFEEESLAQDDQGAVDEDQADLEDRLQGIDLGELYTVYQSDRLLSLTRFALLL